MMHVEDAVGGGSEGYLRLLEGEGGSEAYTMETFYFSSGGLFYSPIEMHTCLFNS